MTQPASEGPPAAAEAAAPPPPSAPGPRVAIARRVIDAAGAFDGYIHRASAIRPSFTSGATVYHAVLVGSVYEPTQLEQGAVAYAALVALQDPEFVQAVQQATADPAARDAFGARLLNQPQSVLEAGAARQAAARVSGVLGRMGGQLIVAGAAVKKAAYDVQAQGWSREAIPDAQQRLAQIKAQSASPVSLLPADTARLVGGLSAFRDADSENTPVDSGAPTGAAVTRGMALAALAIIGKAGENNAEPVQALLTDPLDPHCVEKARRTLIECLAVAGPPYENLFCLGRHAMMDTGQCVVSASGMTEDAALPEEDRQSVLIPVATVATSQHLERDSAFGPGPANDGVSIPLGAAPAPPPPAAYSPYAGPTGE